MAIHSSILAWRIPQTEEPGRLQSVVSQRVRHDWTAEHNPWATSVQGEPEWGLSCLWSHLKPQAPNSQYMCIWAGSGTLHASWKNLIPLIWVMNFFLKWDSRSLGLILILSLFLPVMTNGDHQGLKSLWCSQVCFKGLFPRWNLVALPSQCLAFIWPHIWI